MTFPGFDWHIIQPDFLVFTSILFPDDRRLLEDFEEGQTVNVPRKDMHVVEMKEERLSDAQDNGRHFACGGSQSRFPICSLHRSR